MSRFLSRKPELDFAPHVIPERRVDPVIVVAVIAYLSAITYYLINGV